MKNCPNDKVDHFKALLVTNGFTHVYGDSFSLVTKMPFVCLFLAMTPMCYWALFKLDVKNVFLHNEHGEKIYMETSLFFRRSLIWFINFIALFMG